MPLRERGKFPECWKIVTRFAALALFLCVAANCAFGQAGTTSTKAARSSSTSAIASAAATISTHACLRATWGRHLRRVRRRGEENEARDHAWRRHGGAGAGRRDLRHAAEAMR